MGFAYKKLNSADIKSVPYVANKRYEFTSESYSDNNIITYVGEYIPITVDQPFNPEIDNLTSDQKYRRLIFESIRHLYYQNYITKSSLEQDLEIQDESLLYPDNVNVFWHSSSYDNYLQNTISSGSYPNFRNFPYYTLRANKYDGIGDYDFALYAIENSAKIRVISIPKTLYGEGIKPYTFELSGSDFYIADDGNGNLFDYVALTSDYFGAKYSDPISKYAGNSNELAVPVGNIFYNHGIAVITNDNYICFLETSPVAKNNIIEILNVQEEKLIDILANDFDDCSSINSSSLKTFTYPEYSFPDFTISGSNYELLITPNLTSTVPGEYRLYYSVENNLGIVSNTGSVILRLTSDPLFLEINSITQSCYQNVDNISSSVTFSIDKGIPPYSWSIDGVNYTPVSDIFQPILSASLIPTRSLILSVKDIDGTIVTSSINTSYLPIQGRLWQNDVSFCNISDGTIIASASGDLPITASLSASFANSIELPNTFSALETGSYTVYFKDSNNCITTSQIIVTKTIPVTASYIIEHIDCFGDLTGEIYLNIYDSASGEEKDQNLYLTGGTPPFTYDWTGPAGFTTTSINLYNIPSGTYILNIQDADECIYPFTFNVTASNQISYSAQLDYDNAYTTSLNINDINGGIPPYFVTVSTDISNYYFTQSIPGSYELFLTADGLNSGSCSIHIKDSISCSIATQSFEIFGRVWELTGSNCEDGTGSVAQRNLNFYTNEPTGSEWVTIRIHSGSETPVELATSGSATGSYSWNTNNILYIDIYTGSNDNFYLKREFSGSRDDETGPANVTGSEITSSAIITGNANMIHFNENLDVSLTFGTSHSISSLHLTASKVNTEDLTTNINFKFNKQIDLKVIRDNFISEAANLSTTGSNSSGSNFIARDNKFTDVIYGNTGSFIGPNTLLFRDTYAFGNIINTILGSNVEYTSGSIISGSAFANIFGGENAQYFTQRTDKVWLLTADIDYLDVYSYTNLEYYLNDPIGIRQNTEYIYRDYKIFAGSQRSQHDLMYIMIIHNDEFSELTLPTGEGSGRIFNRKLQNLRDVNRIYYLFLSPIGSSNSQLQLDNRAVAVGKYFIDNVIYG